MATTGTTAVANGNAVDAIVAVITASYTTKIAVPSNPFIDIVDFDNAVEALVSRPPNINVSFKKKHQPLVIYLV